MQRLVCNIGDNILADFLCGNFDVYVGALGNVFVPSLGDDVEEIVIAIKDSNGAISIEGYGFGIWLKNRVLFAVTQ